MAADEIPITIAAKMHVKNLSGLFSNTFDSLGITRMVPYAGCVYL